MVNTNMMSCAERLETIRQEIMLEILSTKKSDILDPRLASMAVSYIETAELYLAKAANALKY